jgi:hypothetical protein
MQTPVCFRAMPFGNKFNQAETDSLPGGDGVGVDPAGTVLAVAGRRIDPAAPDEPRFPAGNEALVALRIRDRMVSAASKVVVCSGACGADILALEAAAQLGLGRRLVLPFARKQFRATSVADRGEGWGRRFDTILQQLQSEDIVELNLQIGSHEAYAATNSEILDQAEGLASGTGRRALAMVIWNGLNRGATDLTDQFRRLAEDRKYQVIQVSTL